MTSILTKAALFIAAVGGIMISDTSAQNSRGNRLVGAWDTTVTIYNCSTGAPIREFASAGTFQDGGTFSGITAGTPPAMRSPELGVWSHLRANRYMFRFKAFMFDTTGTPTGYQVVTHRIELDHDNENYVSDGGVQIFNMAGTQVGAGCSSAVGTRLDL